MQFDINRDILLKSLNFVQGVVEKKNTLPILSNVLLNLKAINVQVHSPGLKKMYLKASGSGELRAGNFETDSETEIMNPDQIIMTLDHLIDL